MQKTIQSALISVFYKTGLETIIPLLHQHGITIYSTGGTHDFIKKLGVPCVLVEDITNYPSILGGRVKTLHPAVFGGILGKRNDDQHVAEMKQYQIPPIDLVIVDLYPFEETVASTGDEQLIIEKIDIGGPSMIRAAAKNHYDLLVIASKQDYAALQNILEAATATTTLAQRRAFAARAFEIVAHYDVAIAQYFHPNPTTHFLKSVGSTTPMRYGENPHQPAVFYGNLAPIFTQLHGKELSYNNLVDVDAALQLVAEFQMAANRTPPWEQGAYFAIIKHTNVCGVAKKQTVKKAWDAAHAADPESAFGGVLVCTQAIDINTAETINEIFFEVLLAPAFNPDALQVLQQKKNRILLQTKQWQPEANQFKSLLGGVLVQTMDAGNFLTWQEAGGRPATHLEKTDLEFANVVCKHLKSNAIALVKNGELIGKGCGQTSRVDALRHALEKAKQFGYNLQGAVLASDAFFPFDDCVKMAHAAGIVAFIQPGGSIRDKDSIAYCVQNNLAMVITGLRHFRH